MTSRFTQTEKWDDTWFRQLSPNAKVVYWYIWDKCNIAGFWEIDWEGLAFNTKVPKRSLEKAFAELERGYIVSGNHIWVRRFLYHQKNLPLNPDNQAHKGVLKLIDEYKSIFPNILQELEKQKNKGATKGLKSPTCIGIGISIGKGKGISKGKEGDFDRFWSEYPKKVGKPKCRNIWARLDPSPELTEQIISKVQAYRETEQWQKDNGKYIPHPSTWLNAGRWEDEITQKSNIKTEYQKLVDSGELKPQ